MLRIIAGEFKGRRLKTLPGREVRPTADRVKGALFSILGERVAGAAVLDLYAGSGNLGIEALSRGAASCVFVDLSSASCALIAENLRSLGLGSRGRVLRADAERSVALLGARGERFGLVFADPPYAKGESKKLLRALNSCGMVAARTLVVVEHHKADLLPDDLTRLRPSGRRRYGDTVLSFLEAGE